MFLPRFIEKRRKRRREKRTQALFRRQALGPGDVVIDGGANIGAVTVRLAGTGARVLAFEPNPDAFAHLQLAFEGHPRVECIPQALSDYNGEGWLYLHKRHQQKDISYSKAASLIADKRNINPQAVHKISCRDICDVIASLDDRVRLLKLDVEGAEFRILHRLIDTGMIGQIDQVFCETHELKAPSLRAEGRRLRQRLRREGIQHVNLDWH